MAKRWYAHVMRQLPGCPLTLSSVLEPSENTPTSDTQPNRLPQSSINALIEQAEWHVGSLKKKVAEFRLATWSLALIEVDMDDNIALCIENYPLK